MALGTGLIEAMNQWRDMGILSYVVQYVIMLFVFFLVSFYLVNRIKFLENEKAVKSLINIFISGFIANILSFLFLQFSIISLFFALFESIGLVILGLIIASSIIVWIWAIIDIIKKSDKKAIWIVNLIIGNIFGGWVYLLSRKSTQTFSSPPHS